VKHLAVPRPERAEAFAGQGGKSPSPRARVGQSWADSKEPGLRAGTYRHGSHASVRMDIAVATAPESQRRKRSSRSVAPRLSPGDEALLPPTASAVRFTRQMVRDLCDLQGVGDIADLACLLANEIVTNAVRHTRTPVLRVDARVIGETLRVSVSDGDPHIPTVLAPSESDVSGRGLLLVDALSTNWGVTPRATGKVVWFTVSGSGEVPLKSR
jgi:hypothetical protein